MAMLGETVRLGFGASVLVGAMAALVLGLLHVLWRSRAEEDEEIREWTGEDKEPEGCKFIDGEEE